VDARRKCRSESMGGPLKKGKEKKMLRKLHAAKVRVGKALG